MISIDALNHAQTPGAGDLAAAVKERRLGLDMAQQALSEKSGVPLPTLKKFERTGQISLAAFLAICDALGVGRNLADLVPPAPPRTLDEVEGRAPRNTRKRASPRDRRA